MAEVSHTSNRRGPISRVITLALLLATNLLPAACTYTARIHPPAIRTPIVVELPVTVGIYFGEELRRHELEEGVLTDKVRFPVGLAAIPWFEHAFAGTFARIVRLEAWPTTTPDTQLDAVIETRLVDFWQRFSEEVSVSFEVIFSTPDGREILRWPITGSYSLNTEMRQLTPGERRALAGKALLQFEEYIGNQVASALRQAATKFLLDFREQESVKRWLEAGGAFRPILPNQGGLLPAESLVSPGSAPAVVITGDRSYCGENLIEELSLTPDQLTVLSFAETRDTFYPWLEPEVDFSATRFLQIAQTPRGAAQLERTGLRYVVLLSSEREKTEGGGIWCGGGFGAGGCFGVMWGDTKATLIAAVSDLQRGVIETRTTEGKSGYFIPAFVLPIPVWWDTEAEACTELAHAIRAYFNSFR